MFTPMWYSATFVSVKGRNSLRACFRTSMEQERSFKWINIFKKLRFLNFLWTLNWGGFQSLRFKFHPLRCGFPFINNSIKLKYNITLLVHKSWNKSYASGVICVINVIEWKFCFFINELHEPLFIVHVTKKRRLVF